MLLSIKSYAGIIDTHQVARTLQTCNLFRPSARTVASFPVTSFLCSQQCILFRGLIHAAFSNARIQPMRKEKILIVIIFKLLQFLYAYVLNPVSIIQNLPSPTMYHINKDADTCQYTSVKSVYYICYTICSQITQFFDILSNALPRDKVTSFR